MRVTSTWAIFDLYAALISLPLPLDNEAGTLLSRVLVIGRNLAAVQPISFLMPLPLDNKLPLPKYYQMA